jgi:hypothetical protein
MRFPDDIKEQRLFYFGKNENYSCDQGNDVNIEVHFIILRL